MATLLVADDSPSIASAIEHALAGADVHVVSVLSGQRALASIEADPPAIVIADIGMARITGYDIASYMKNSPALANIPVLLLTGPFDRIDEDKARATRCDGVLVKPINSPLLRDVVLRLLAGGAISPAALWPTDLPKVDTWDFEQAAAALKHDIGGALDTPDADVAAIFDLAPALPAEPEEAETHGWTASRERLTPADTEHLEAGLDQLDADFDRNGPAPALLNARVAAAFASDMTVLRGSFSAGRQTSPSNGRPQPRTMLEASRPSADTAAARHTWIPDPTPPSAVEQPAATQLKIKVKIGGVEFQAEGPADVVQTQLDEFKRMIGPTSGSSPRVRSMSQRAKSSPREESRPVEHAWPGAAARH